MAVNLKVFIVILSAPCLTYGEAEKSGGSSFTYDKSGLRYMSSTGRTNGWIGVRAQLRY
jgi:hypothetical protein